LTVDVGAMGASQSKPDGHKVFYNETPIQFSQEVIDHLQESAGSPDTSPDRQSTLDAHIKARINAELGRLREEEKLVREQIEAALEKENLSRERAGIDGDEAEGGVTSSSSIQGALDEVQRKVDRFHGKRDLGGYLLVGESSQKLIECYRSHQKTPLDCWREVDAFKSAVATEEQRYVSSLRQ